MCGIAGIVAEHCEKYRDAVERMMEKLIHRGPDDHGIHLFRNCILGHTRLSIIDLVTGQKPMLFRAQSGSPFSFHVSHLTAVGRFTFYD